MAWHTIEVDLSVYPEEAVKRAAYYLSDAAYFKLERKGEGKLTVLFEPKSGEDAERLEKEFFNKILVAMVEIDSERRSEEVRKLLSAGVLASALMPQGRKQVEKPPEGKKDETQ